jgi:hypothetical protein
MKRAAAMMSLALAAGAVVVPASTAQAADFCAGKIGASSYYQANFTSGGNVVATICAPGYNVSGNAYLYARGSYANVQKYMKLVVTSHTAGGSTTVQVDGQYYSYVYRAQGRGGHDYHAVMYDGNGHKIVDGYRSDYE